MSGKSIFDAAAAVLATADAEDKAAASVTAAARFAAAELDMSPGAAPPDRPSRPNQPELKSPTDMPRRKAGGVKGRAALLHAVAHIELNAIDLAWDMVARFGGDPMFRSDTGRRAFVSDWVRIGAEEATHFRMVSERLATLGARYGDFPAHDGLWDAAEKTKGDILGRLAIAPMVLEARGLDVTPAMAKKLRDAGDEDSAAVLDIIYQDEIGHVGAGAKWFSHLCSKEGKDEKSSFHALVGQYFPGGLKLPFNEEARNKAGLLPDLYRPLAR